MTAAGGTSGAGGAEDGGAAPRGAPEARGTASRNAPRRDALGYMLVIVSSLGQAGAAPLVAWAGAPEAVILCLRMAFAALALGVVFLRGRMIDDWRHPGAAWRLIVMAAMSSLTLLLFFFAVRHTSVAVAMFLMSLMPLWIALLAPRVFHSPREPIVWPALALALGGLAVMLLPDIVGGGVHLSLAGVLAALFAGFGWATYAISVKGLTHRVSSATISMAEAAGDAVIVLPLALWQLSSTGYHLDAHVLLAAVLMGIVCTAIPYTLWIEGTRRVRVEHVTILSFLEPVVGPLYAIALVGQLPPVWTWVGGALILGAGLLVVAFGRGEGEMDAALAEAETL